MSQLGMGVMIRMLGGNKETVEAIRASLGKKIRAAELSGNTLELTFDDGSVLALADNGQSCCEERYMRTDDDLTKFAGATFDDIELAEAPSLPYEYGSHDVQFLNVKTSLGVFTMSNHVEHNGYYGGFSIEATVRA